MAYLLMESAFNLGAVVIVIAAIVASWVVMYAVMRQHMEQTSTQLKREFEQKLNALTASAKATQPQPQAAPAQKAAPAPAPVVAAQASPAAKPAPQPAPVVAGVQEDIAPETLLVIAAAVTAYLGKKVKIRSARMIYSHENYNSWSQQGRVFVQASHNLAQRGF